MREILTADFVLTMQDDKVLQNYSVVVENTKILDILPRAEALKKYADYAEQYLPECLLMPSLINMHNHLPMVLFRGMADDLALGDWLQNHIWPAEAKWVSEEFVRAGAKIAMAEMMLSGTGFSSDMYFFPEVVAEVAEKLGFKVQLAAPIIEFPNAWSQNPQQALEKIEKLFVKYKDSEFVDIALGPHAPYTLSDESFLAIKEFMQKNPAINLQIHLHETEQEVVDSIKEHGKTGIARLADLGILSSRVQAVHMTQISDADMQILTEYKVNIVHCPQSNLKLASGFSPIEAMRKQGLTIAIGTDGAASNNDLDMFSEIQTAALLAKAVAKDAQAFSAYEALKAASINAAQIMGKSANIGSLDIGKSADICAVDISLLNAKPNFSNLSNLVYTNNGSKVKHLWINGKKQVENFALKNLDMAELKQILQIWQNKIETAN